MLALSSAFLQGRLTITVIIINDDIGGNISHSTLQSRKVYFVLFLILPPTLFSLHVPISIFTCQYAVAFGEEAYGSMLGKI
jgi:hypothetical protein